MSKFVIVKHPPQTLDSHEFVIGAPDFRKEIAASKAKKPRGHTLTVNYIREVIAAVGAKYIGEDFDALRSINVSKFVGVPCDTEDQINDIVVKAFENQYPELLYAYVLHCFKQRPSGTNLIYYTGNPKYSSKLIELGYEQILSKDLENIKSGKPKKVVGKPAITNEQASVLNAE